VERVFYLRDSRSNTGNNVAFWNKNGSGYGTHLERLEMYDLEQAQQMHNSRNTDIPLLKSAVDVLSILAVDCQYLPEEDLTDPNDQYVVQRKGYWNGNDISFVGQQKATYNYEQAAVFSKDTLTFDKESYTVFSKASIDKIARRTFQAHNIDMKAMSINAGIKIKKPKLSRPTTGKTRGNCPQCGRITWDYDPYENAYCVGCN